MINYYSLSFTIKRWRGGEGGRRRLLSFVPLKSLNGVGLLGEEGVRKRVVRQSGVVILAGAQSLALTSPTDSSGD